MKNIVYPDYKNSTLQIPNSILAYLGANPHHSTLATLDERLNKKQWKNVIFFVFDGMGTDALEKHSPHGFFMKNRICDLTAVCPSTTATALTTFDTGLTPIEHGWLGWSCYFKEINKEVALFTGKEFGTNRQATDYNIVKKLVSNKSVFEQLMEEVKLKSHYLSPFPNLVVQKICRNIGRNYIYAYSANPDHIMHDLGCSHEKVGKMIRTQEKKIERLCRKLKDALVIVSADHGLLDVKFVDIDGFPDVMSCLTVPISRDGRNISFHVKEEQMTDFPAIFNKHFSEDYILLATEEALKNGYFGGGTPHPKAKDFLGDFVAIAIGKTSLYSGSIINYAPFKAMHGGFCKEEMIVPLIVVECP